jgi:hypothetical protein
MQCSKRNKYFQKTKLIVFFTMPGVNRFPKIGPLNLKICVVNKN